MFHRPTHPLLRAIATSLLLTAPVALPAQNAPDLAGTWRGTLVNLPARPNAARVDVTIELGALPTTVGACVPWRTTYAERDTVRAVKNYKLCRGAGANEYVVDEGDGVRLRADLLGDVLVSAFKAGPTLLLTHLRVRGDTLEEEIVSVSDAPSGTGVVTMPARNLQRIVATRRDRAAPPAALRQ